MKRTVNRSVIDTWVAKHGPDGLSRLAVESGISASTLQKARYNLSAPKKISTLQRICDVLGVKIDEVFPLEQSTGKAS